MAGMLSAIPKTPLYDRLEAEGRLDNAAADDPEIATNVIPLSMTRETLRDGWLDLMDRLYEADNFLDRFDDLFIEGRSRLPRARMSWLRRHRPAELPQDPVSDDPRGARTAFTDLARPADPSLPHGLCPSPPEAYPRWPPSALPLSVRMEVYHAYPLRHHDPADGPGRIAAGQHMSSVSRSKSGSGTADCQNNAQ